MWSLWCLRDLSWTWAARQLLSNSLAHLKKSWITTKFYYQITVKVTNVICNLWITLKYQLIYSAFTQKILKILSSFIHTRVSPNQFSSVEHKRKMSNSKWVALDNIKITLRYCAVNITLIFDICWHEKEFPLIFFFRAWGFVWFVKIVPLRCQLSDKSTFKVFGMGPSDLWNVNFCFDDSFIFTL